MNDSNIRKMRRRSLLGSAVLLAAPAVLSGPAFAITPAEIIRCARQARAG
jgi:hypothetical protein